jgi:succinate dehydrogenase / fumarate reductase cytochrome b subunit
MRRHFYLRRLHSLSGVVPLGLFLADHLWTNAHAVYGREAFNRAVGDIQSLPLLVYIELFGIGLPLLFHSVYGLVISANARANVGRYPHARNWMFLLQRVSGVAMVAFIGLHLWQYRVQKLLGVVAWQDFYERLGRDLNTPWIFAVYVTGVTATVYHFANGLWLFGNTWGITVSERSMRRSAWASGAVGVLLWALGMNTLLHFAVHCGGVIPMPEQQVAQTCGVR